MSQDYRALVRDALRAGGAGKVAEKAAADDPDPEATLVARQGASVELQRRVAGINPLLGAANVLLALVPQLRATTSHPDPARLHRQLLTRVTEFEIAAKGSGVPPQKVVAARYVLCTFIDEVAAATPWGGSGAWAEHNLLQEFHDERDGGEKAFKLLERLGEDVAENLDVLELFYVCIALGFEGRYRGKPNGRAQLDAIAARLVEVLRPEETRRNSRTLSLRWEGVLMQRSRTLMVLPIWVVVAIGSAIVLGAFLLLNARLNSQSRPAFRQIAAVPATLRGDEGAPANAAPAPARLATPLAADIAANAIEVRDEALRSVVIVPADSLFAAGTAQIEPRNNELLGRIAQALAMQPGQVVVSGHADNVPVSSLQFPSSWHLTRERASAVAAVLVQRGLRADRVRAEGLADAEPRGPNATPAERARNRRVEIVLQLPRPDAAQ
ncbi:MAG TPA: type IVB secretion system protein IcmH/DotU [Burkholderiaceae bacterium]|nr:type IVB secretion system protein IcmH/DotU [Burkholderiaceae bacterium]